MNRGERLAVDGYAGVEPVLFYRPKDPYGWASNFSPHAVALLNPWTDLQVTYPTSEHRFQAMKAKTGEDHDYVLAAASAGESKTRGGPRGVELRDGWGDSYGDLCWYVMCEVVVAKAIQHEDIQTALADTHGRPIYEDSPTDDIWGWRFEQSYSGKNLLGLCWMAVREMLR